MDYIYGKFVDFRIIDSITKDSFVIGLLYWENVKDITKKRVKNKEIVNIQLFKYKLYLKKLRILEIKQKSYEILDDESE